MRFGKRTIDLNLKSEANQWAMFSLLASLLVGGLLKLSVTWGWTKARGEEPPRTPEQADTTWTTALLWAICTGIGVAISQVVARRGAAKLWTGPLGRRMPRREEAPVV